MEDDLYDARAYFDGLWYAEWPTPPFWPGAASRKKPKSGDHGFE